MRSDQDLASPLTNRFDGRTMIWHRLSPELTVGCPTLPDFERVGLFPELPNVSSQSFASEFLCALCVSAVNAF